MQRRPRGCDQRAGLQHWEGIIILCVSVSAPVCVVLWLMSQAGDQSWRVGVYPNRSVAVCRAQPWTPMRSEARGRVLWTNGICVTPRVNLGGWRCSEKTFACRRVVDSFVTFADSRSSLVPVIVTAYNLSFEFAANAKPLLSTETCCQAVIMFGL